jgi:hypothetical protein
MVRLLAYAVTGRAFNYPGIYLPRQAMLDRIRSGNYLIIGDEIQRLKLAPLGVWREVYDDAGATVVLAGTPDLEANLARNGMESLFSRIGLHHRMEALTLEQVQKLLPGWEPAVHRRIYAHTGGVFRRIEHLVRLCGQICEVEEIPKVTMEVLGEAVRHIPDLLPGDVKGKVSPPSAARAELARPARAPMPEVASAAVAKQSAG